LLIFDGICGNERQMLRVAVGNAEFSQFDEMTVVEYRQPDPNCGRSAGIWNNELLPAVNFRWRPLKCRCN